MKKLFISGIVVFAFLASCQDKSKADKAVLTDASTSTKTYAYTTARPVGWEWGSDDNLTVAMNALKAYETGDMDACMKYFADTVRVEFDGFDKVMSNDSLKAMFKNQRATFKRVEIKMDDYESVKSKHDSIEYVSLWYKEIMEDMKGKVDSAETINDIRIKNGKINLLNEKIRHYAVKKM